VSSPVGVWVWTVAQLRVENHVNAYGGKSRPARPQVLHGVHRAPRFRLTDSGHRLLEIRRATHSLNRSHLVFMVPTVHLAAADLPPYPAHDGVRSVRVANHRQRVRHRRQQGHQGRLR
jgi:hypothetical protein